MYTIEFLNEHYTTLEGAKNRIKTMPKNELEELFGDGSGEYENVDIINLGEPESPVLYTHCIYNGETVTFSAETREVL